MKDRQAIFGRLLGLALLLMVIIVGGTTLAAPQRPSRANNGSPLQSSLSPTSGYDQYGGWNALPISNATGFFRTAVVSGASWLVTPDGHAFFSLGLNAIGYSGNPAVFESYDQRMFDQYHNVNAWAAATSAIIRGWGFNTIGGFSGREITDHQLAETRVLRLAATSIAAPYNVPHVNGLFPDVFDPHFAPAVNQIATAAISDTDISDPWLLGYFLDNELYWYKDGYWSDNPASTLTENFIALSGSAAGKQAWVGYLQASYPSITALNNAWATGYTSFSGSESTSLLNTTSITATGAITDKYAFLSNIATQYYSVTTSAVRSRDPNHLIFSDRFVGIPLYRQIIAAAGQYVDAIALNIYDDTADNLTLGDLDEASAWSGKPALVSEYGFRAVTSGMANQPYVKGGWLPTDADRASAYRLMMSETLRRPGVIGAHWFMYADNPTLFDPVYSGHYSWGFVDINGHPYTGLSDSATTFNTDLYYRRLVQPAASLEPPTPLSPMYNAPVFTANPTFTWRPVVGATSYTWQAARTPNFANPLTVDGLATTTYTSVNALDWGRWYWRIRVDSMVSDTLAYTAPQPFYVLRQAASILVNGFETAPDVTLQGQGSDYRWAAEVNGDISMTGTTSFGVTQGQQAGLLTFSGQTNGLGNHYGWAVMSRYPAGPAFTPRDWSGFNYLTLDFSYTGPITSTPYAEVGFNDAADKGNTTTLPIRAGTTQAVVSIDAAVRGGMNPALMAGLVIGTDRPAAGMQMAVDNLMLRQVARDIAPQPPITPIVSDVQVSGTLLLDWRGYQPATSTVAYLVYITDTANTPISSLTPVLRLDAVGQSTLLKVQLNPHSPTRDSYGYDDLHNGQPFYVTIIPVDFWGNLGAVGPTIAATTSECGLSFSDVPFSYWAATYINHIACLHIVNGVGGGLFQPNGSASRDQFAKMISLAQGWPLTTPTAPTFSDVPPSNPLYTFVETAVSHNAISGANAATCAARGLAVPCFLPHDPISRAQLAVILVRAYGWATDTSGGPHFTDVPPTGFGYAAIETCYNRGIVSGIGGGLFQPNGAITRAQMARMLYRAIRQPLLPQRLALQPRHRLRHLGEGDFLLAIVVRFAHRQAVSHLAGAEALLVAQAEDVVYRPLRRTAQRSRTAGAQRLDGLVQQLT